MCSPQLAGWFVLFFFFNDTATTEIYTLSLHDALPISCSRAVNCCQSGSTSKTGSCTRPPIDRKSTRLNSSHLVISYAVFCLKKKTQPFQRRRVSPPAKHHGRRITGPGDQRPSRVRSAT